jgi:hypothetical protein
MWSKPPSCKTENICIRLRMNQKFYQKIGIYYYIQSKKRVGLEIEYKPLTSFISRLKINHCGAQVIKKNVQYIAQNSHRILRGPPVAEVIIQLAQYYTYFSLSHKSRSNGSVAWRRPKKSGHLYTDQRVKRKDARLTGCDLRA